MPGEPVEQRKEFLRFGCGDGRVGLTLPAVKDRIAAVGNACEDLDDLRRCIVMFTPPRGQGVGDGPEEYPSWGPGLRDLPESLREAEFGLRLRGAFAPCRDPSGHAKARDGAEGDGANDLNEPEEHSRST